MVGDVPGLKWQPPGCCRTPARCDEFKLFKANAAFGRRRPDDDWAGWSAGRSNRQDLPFGLSGYGKSQVDPGQVEIT
jgi:hypothetical protein